MGIETGPRWVMLVVESLAVWKAGHVCSDCYSCVTSTVPLRWWRSNAHFPFEAVRRASRELAAEMSVGEGVVVATANEMCRI